MPQPAQQPGKSEQVFRTPDDFRQAVLARLGIAAFQFDFAADATNAFATCFWDEDVNSLTQPIDRWIDMLEQPGRTGWGWLNPPFARIVPWVEYCHEVGVLGGNIALLVPAAVGANWWRDHVHNVAEVLLLNGRIHFLPDEPKWGYPKDCALCLYGPGTEPGYEVWTWKESA